MPPLEAPAGRLENAVLLTVLYADLFDHALSEGELRRYLVAPAEPAELAEKLDSLRLAGWLQRREDHVVWSGRLGLIELRRERRERSRHLWRQAREVADSLARIPFLRMVAVCGSLAVENVVPDADIDLFLVTEKDRLWLVQWRAMQCRRRLARRGIEACPNYFLTFESLGLTRRDLHTAREVAHVVPLWGAPAYDRFLAANRWIFDLLPNLELEDRRRLLAEAPHPPSTPRWEARLRGRSGDLLDRALHRLLLLYYPWRLRRRGVDATQIRAAYRRDRQEVVGGGYGSAIRERFLRRVHERLGDEAIRMAEQELFPGRAPEVGPVALYGRQLEERYGVGP